MHDFFKEFDAASAKFHQAHHEAHQRAHQRAHQQAHQQAHQRAQQGFFDFGSLFDDDDGGFGIDLNSMGEDHLDLGDLFGGFGGGGFASNNIHVHTSSSSKSSHQSCRTVTRREGNTVSTMTECH